MLQAFPYPAPLPVQIANALAPCIGGDCVERAEAVNGYLNIYLSGAYLLSRLVPRIPEEKENYGAPDIGQGRVVVLDYSSRMSPSPSTSGIRGRLLSGTRSRNCTSLPGITASASTIWVIGGRSSAS